MEPPAPPTHDEDLERRVLGALMHTQQTPERLEEALNILARSDFYYHLHRDTYTAITTIHQRGDTPDWLLVSDELHTQGYASVNGHSIGDLRVATMQYVEEVPVAANALAYARDLHTLATRRRLQTAAQRILLANGTGPIDTNEIQEAIEASHANTSGPRMRLVPWNTFREEASEHVDWLVDQIWPAAVPGVIAGAQKAHKTWLGIELAVAVATGHPYLGQYAIREPRPVIYLGLEGTKANIKTRIGCLARGRGLDPDHELANLHLIWKPKRIDLSDPAWINELVDHVETINAGLVVIDVLRQATSTKENDNTEIAQLFRNLKAIEEHDCAVALLHHFAKMSEQLKERSPIERTSGGGAIGGAVDVGIYITSPPEAPKIRVHIVSRNDASPPPFGVAFEGHPTGENNGYRYIDSLRLRATLETPDEDDVKAPPRELAAFVRDQGGHVTVTTIRNAFDISRQTLLRRRSGMARHGVLYIGEGNDSYFQYMPEFDPERETDE